jgi:hypothetical protein
LCVSAGVAGANIKRDEINAEEKCILAVSRDIKDLLFAGGY